MVDTPPDLSVGTFVMAKYRDGNMYPAEITKVFPDSYQVAWLDGDAKSKVSKADLYPLEIVTARKLKIGDRAIVDYGADYWYSGTISGLFEVGYHVTWDDGSPEERILDAAVWPLETPSSELLPGDDVLVLEDNYWRPGKVTGVFQDGYEVAYGEKARKVKRHSEHVRRRPRSAALPPTVIEVDDATPPTQHSDDAANLEQYLRQRVGQDKLEFVKDSEENQFCPRCNRHHTVRWLRDNRYGARLFVCNDRAIPAVIRKDDDVPALKVLTVAQLLSDYPAVKSDKGNLLGWLSKNTEIEVSPFPPFVKVKAGARR